MRLESIQIAAPRTLDVAGRAIETGIFKTSVGDASVGRLGVSGDSVVNRKHHGGPDQAVYVYSAQDYAWWEAELDGELAPGTFGENLTFADFGVGEVMIGDRWRLGEVLLETTAPRIPCATLGAKMADPEFPRRFRAARRPGFYARVVEPGPVRAGIEIQRIATTGTIPLLELFDLVYDREADAPRLQRALLAPVAERARADLERRLARSVAGGGTATPLTGG